MTSDSLLEQFDVMVEAPDGVERLRDLILQLAVRGKLVPQDNREEPSPALLDRIAHSGESRVRALPPIAAADAPYPIPATWCWVRLGTVANQRLGKMLDKAKNKGTPYPYLRNTNVQWHRFDLRDVKEMRFESDELDEYEVREGDLLICEGGEPGRGAVWPGGAGRMMFQKALHRVRTHDGVSTWYLLYVLQAAARSGTLASYFTGATIKHLTGQALERFIMPLPPASEQRRIVAKVKELMALCDELETRQQQRAETQERANGAVLQQLTAATDDAELAIAWERLHESFDVLYDVPQTVEGLRQTVLQLAVCGRLLPTDGTAQSAGSNQLHALPVEESPEASLQLPTGWRWARLSEVTYKITDGTHRTPTYVPMGVPFLSVKDFSGGTLDFSDTRFISKHEHEELYRRCDPRRGDVLIGRIGTLGKPVVVETDREFSLFVSVGLIRPVQEVLDAYFLRLVLSAPLAAQQFARIRVGGATHTNKLNLGDLRDLAVPVPPIQEQRRLVARVRELMERCDLLEARLTRARDRASHLAASVVNRLTAA